MNGYIIYTAPWIIPVNAAVLRDGAIVVNSDIIVTIGPRDEILEEWCDAEVINLSGILLPPLTNCHIHLELSHLTEISQPEKDSSMIEWIEQLISRRADEESSDDAIVESLNETIRQQYLSGVILLGDICNIRENLARQQKGMVEVYSFYELIAPDRHRTAEALQLLSILPAEQAASPHAVYSTSAQLIVSIKKRAEENGQIISIHVSESPEELDFIVNRSGPFRKFLEKRNSWDGTIFPDCPYQGSVDYLKKLDVLDENTLCVHCVHITDDEILLLAAANAKVCLCPSSNEFLGVGRAPLPKMLAAGLMPGIGTDSSASNKLLDMWNEMKLLRNNYPDVPAEIILQMATCWGAAALHRDEDYGILAPGKKPVFLEISIPPNSDVNSENIIDIITLAGKPEVIRWITADTKDV